MSESTPEAPAADAAQAPDAEPEVFDRAYVEALRKENAKYRTKASEATAAEKAAEKARLAAMSEAERAVAEAEKRGETAAMSRLAQRLAQEQFRVHAARVNPEFDADAVLEDLNWSRYVNEDNEPDTDAIKSAVQRFVQPPPSNPRPVGDADLGSRGTPLALNGDPIERALRSKLGIT